MVEKKKIVSVNRPSEYLEVSLITQIWSRIYWYWIQIANNSYWYLWVMTHLREFISYIYLLDNYVDTRQNVDLSLLPPFHKRCHTFLFNLSHKRCHIFLFGKNFLLHEYKNYIFSLHLTYKTKPPKISCRSTNVTSFVGLREYFF